MHQLVYLPVGETIKVCLFLVKKLKLLKTQDIIIEYTNQNRFENYSSPMKFCLQKITA